jgi:hypothetical protein
LIQEADRIWSRIVIDVAQKFAKRVVSGHRQELPKNELSESMRLVSPS